MTRHPYPAYTPSGVAWLGDVPEHWEIKRLKYQCSINDETLPENTDPEYELLYVDISSVNPVQGIVQKEPMIFENAPSRARRIVKDGDTIVSTVRTYLRAISPIKNPESNLIVSTGFAVIRPKGIDKNYLSTVIKAPYFIEEVVSRSVGVSYPAINSSEIGMIPIPLPPLTEQHAIAAFLDRETGRMDTLIAKKRRLLELLKEQRAALISRAVTKGLDASVKLKPSGVAWLGDVPEHWEIKKSRFLFSFVSGGTPSTEELNYWNGDIPWVSSKDMKRFCIDDTEDHITDQAVSESATKIIPQNTLLLVMRSGILQHSIPACIIKKEMTINQDIKAFLPLKPLFPEYYALFIQGNQQQLLTEWRKEGATVESLDMELIKNFTFPVPPLHEQQAIAAHLDRETAKLDALAAKVEIVIARLAEYRTALISAAVTGKIDVRTTA